MQNIILYYKEGSSDKVYQASLEPYDGAWIVCFAFGRRGTLLTNGIETPSPLPYEKAERIYQKLIAAKMAKGYTPGASGTPYRGGSGDTGVRPQLLNALTEQELESLLKDDDFLLQPKLDGKRLLIQKRGLHVIGINRRGLECGLPETLRQAALSLSEDFLVDGEAIEDTLHVFDLLERGKRNLKLLPYEQRMEELRSLLESKKQEGIRLVETYSGPPKREKLDLLRHENVEGVVLKRASAPYSPGRPASGGNQRKFKFVETASVIVSAINRQRSVVMSLWADDTLHFAGNVTIPANHPMPTIGQIAEVRYLYAMPDSGALFQPVYLGARKDVEPAECLRSQLKYKA